MNSIGICQIRLLIILRGDILFVDRMRLLPAGPQDTLVGELGELCFPHSPYAPEISVFVLLLFTFT